MPPRKKLKLDRAQEGATANTRRSTRASTKVTTTTIATDASNDQPPVASVAPAVVKLRRGCLKEIPNFAVEIQLMIFGNLHPVDLFNLSRTSKMFHQFFLHRSNEALWVAALENAQDLPERPPGMHIPAFIHLLYSTHCHNCGSPNIRKVIWPWFARYCSSCLPKITCTYSDVSMKFWEAGISMYSIGDVLYGIQSPTTRRRTSRQAATLRNIYWYLERHVDDIIAKWSALPQPKGLETAKALRIQCTDDLRFRLKYAYRCEEWHDKQEEDHQDDLRNVRTERFSAIIKKLKETGWEKDLDFLGPDGLEQMSNMPVVRQSAKLTRKGWDKVQEVLDTFLTETRAKRIEDERNTAVRQRFADLDEAIMAHCVTLPRNAVMDCRPVALDLALSKELEPFANAPAAETITRETFAAIVPKLVDDWYAEQRQFLWSLLGRFIRRVPPGVDILDLAVAVVYTDLYCDEVQLMHYPHMLANSCLRHTGISRGQGELPSGHYAAVIASDQRKGPFNLHSLDTEKVAQGIEWMCNIVLNLGLDPDTATISDLEQREARVRCLRCPDAGLPDHAYTWDAAFAHTAKHRDGGPSRKVHDRWAGVPESELARVKELEATAHVLSTDLECWWSCALCVNWKGWKKSIRKHLASEHNIENADGAIADGTIYWSSAYNTRDGIKPGVPL